MTPEEVVDEVKHLKYPPYDYLVIADGSGTTTRGGAGWWAVIHDFKTQTVQEMGGHVGIGTNNYAELAPFIHALWVIHGKEGLGKKPTCVFITDSEITANCGSGRFQRSANLAYWAAYDWFTKEGFAIHWLWVPRCSFPLHKYCDWMAGKMRKLEVNL